MKLTLDRTLFEQLDKLWSPDAIAPAATVGTGAATQDAGDVSGRRER